MDRKEIVELLRQMANGPAAVYGTDALDAFAAAADLLAADGWVNVSERLPERGRVMIFSPAYPDGHEMRYRIIDASLVCKMVDVTHWRQPLPPEPDHD